MGDEFDDDEDLGMADRTADRANPGVILQQPLRFPAPKPFKGKDEEFDISII